jgi:hypothetical protein
MRDLGTLGGTDSDAYAVNNIRAGGGVKQYRRQLCPPRLPLRRTPGSGTRAFLLDASALVPEPASVSLLALAARPCCSAATEDLGTQTGTVREKCA